MAQLQICVVVSHPFYGPGTKAGSQLAGPTHKLLEVTMRTWHKAKHRIYMLKQRECLDFVFEFIPRDPTVCFRRKVFKKIRRLQHHFKCGPGNVARREGAQRQRARNQIVYLIWRCLIYALVNLSKKMIDRKSVV